MQVKVLFFASGRELVGLEMDHLILPGSTVSMPQLIEALTAKHPSILQILESSMIAVNMSYVDKQGLLEDGEYVQIRDGDEIAVIPPVSGG
ncbi:hypothetical protein BDV3_002793 [Batrachochytrium dendrobatidis]|nr:Molybdopterin synthase catalytic subunit [Batrachochytrium dendrobatidis]KAK5672526.1 Molybdopterin synthase catalytic subunit [Batrachochytrium dendrobatidis]